MMMGPDFKLRNSERKHVDWKYRLAFHRLQDETCSGCGVPSWHGRTENSLIEYKERSSTCESCAEKERREKERSKGKKEYPGTSFYPVPYVRSIKDGNGETTVGVLPGRQAWLEEQGVIYDRVIAAEKNRGEM